ncbi:hypothetical protein FKM82_029752 [Ascaphus truei]
MYRVCGYGWYILHRPLYNLPCWQCLPVFIHSDQNRWNSGKDNLYQRL